MQMLIALCAILPLLAGALAGAPDKIYGVNLGSWYVVRSPVCSACSHFGLARLLIESWMLPTGEPQYFVA